MYVIIRYRLRCVCCVMLCYVLLSCIAVCYVSNGNKTEWRPIRSEILQVITKSDDRAAGVRFVYYEYDYRPNWTTRSLIMN